MLDEVVNIESSCDFFCYLQIGGQYLFSVGLKFVCVF